MWASAIWRPNWLTLPIAQHARSVRIADLRFADNARSTWAARLEQQSWYRTDGTGTQKGLRDVLEIRTASVAEYLCDQIGFIRHLFGIDCRLSCSSALDIAPAAKRQGRIIAIAMVSDTYYINPPGGTALYQAGEIHRNGLSLEFLPPHTGPFLARSGETTFR